MFRIRRSCIGICVIAAALGVGCNQTGQNRDSMNSTGDDSSAAASPGTNADASSPSASATDGAKPDATTIRHDENTAAQGAPTLPSASEAGDRFSQEEKEFQATAERRAETENLIYAQIRIKMEEMIDQRAVLLHAGKSPSDVQIRQLEGSIMKARELLTENGEIVDEVEPPIVQSPK